MPRSTGTQDGWTRSARLAFEKSAGRATTSRPNLPYTRTNKRLHLALKKHVDWRVAARRMRRKSQRESDGGEGKGEGTWIGKRADLMPVTLISAAGHEGLSSTKRAMQRSRFGPRVAREKREQIEPIHGTREGGERARGEEQRRGDRPRIPGHEAGGARVLGSGQKWLMHWDKHIWH